MEQTLHYLLMANHLIFQKTFLSKIKPAALTSGQPKILDYLKYHNGAVQKEIAAACHIEPATLTSLLLGMEHKQLITRKMRNGNRRSLYVYLTEKGKKTADYVQTEFCALEQKALMGFCKEEQELFTQFLLRIHENIKHKGEQPND